MEKIGAYLDGNGENGKERASISTRPSKSEPKSAIFPRKEKAAPEHP